MGKGRQKQDHQLVTRQGKSRISPKTFVASAFVFLLASLFLCVGISALRKAMEKPSIESINQQRALWANWPSVKGTLDRIDITPYSYRPYSGTTHTDYYSDVKYHYQVGAKNFTGDCLRKRLKETDKDPYFCSDPIGGLKAAKAKLAEFLPSDAPDNWHTKDKSCVVYSYFPNRTVDVYYDPKNPNSSMLDNRLQSENWTEYYGDQIFEAAIGFVFSAFTFFILFVGFSRSSRPVLPKHAETSALIEPIPLEEQWKVDKNIAQKHHNPDELP